MQLQLFTVFQYLSIKIFFSLFKAQYWEPGNNFYQVSMSYIAGLGDQYFNSIIIDRGVSSFFEMNALYYEG